MATEKDRSRPMHVRLTARQMQRLREMVENGEILNAGEGVRIAVSNFTQRQQQQKEAAARESRNAG